MDTASLQIPPNRMAVFYRPLILSSIALILLYLFWVTSRYPQLFTKASHLGQALPSMAYGSETFAVATDASLGQKIFLGAINWLDGMKIGMSFGVLFGALLHTVLMHYPLKVGKNLALNSVKGALVGVPMGVCANCAVPMACGVTRGHGRVEVALGFLFSSPNFNPIIVMMTFAALPLAVGLVKYTILLLVILCVVPFLAGRIDDKDNVQTVTTTSNAPAIPTLSAYAPRPSAGVALSLGDTLRNTAVEYGKNVWMLLKPTIFLMLLASIIASSLLSLIPWPELLVHATPLRLALVTLISVFMPVPIALDVMFALLLHQQGVSTAYVMLFAMTLGTFSIVPAFYLWREVSRPLATGLYGFFALVGFVTACCFA